jgi:putative alpha-1,2-mannosidase
LKPTAAAIYSFITGGRPFGLASAAPYTRNKNQNGGAYNYNEEAILGFNQIHDWMITGIDVMPTPANINPSLGSAGLEIKV